jgi:hypothetical protein
MLYPVSPKIIELKRRLEDFMDEHIYPNEERFYREAEELGPWMVFPIVEELKPLAKAKSLWNLFLPQSEHGAGLTNLEYAPLCEVMGRSHLAPEVFNCSAPRHRKYGSSGALWLASRQGAMAETNARRRNSVVLRDDGAGCRILRRDQYRKFDRSRRRSLRDQRA